MSIYQNVKKQKYKDEEKDTNNKEKQESIKSKGKNGRSMSDIKDSFVSLSIFFYFS